MPRLDVQDVIDALPKWARRIKVAQALAKIVRSPHQYIEFGANSLIGDVRDGAVANALVKRAFADYGYWGLAKQVLRAGDVHVDVGANYGFHTFGILDADRDAAWRHVLVEPNLDCVRCLRASARAHPRHRVAVVHCAAGAGRGAAVLRFDRANSATGYLSSQRQTSSVAVDVRPLDDILTQEGVESVGLMKMDVEGSELNAFRGMSGFLAQHRVRLIYFEVNPAALVLQGASLAALFSEIQRHDYRLFWPHEDLEWIRDTYNNGPLEPSLMRRYVLSAKTPRALIEFDPGSVEDHLFRSCDLLAVGPECTLAK